MACKSLLTGCQHLRTEQTGVAHNHKNMGIKCLKMNISVKAIVVKNTMLFLHNNMLATEIKSVTYTALTLMVFLNGI